MAHVPDKLGPRTELLSCSVLGLQPSVGLYTVKNFRQNEHQLTTSAWQTSTDQTLQPTSGSSS